MKKSFSFIVVLLVIANALAQNVGIGTTTPSALLELKKPNQFQSNLVFSGQEYFQAGWSATGIALMIGVNRPGNKQLWLADIDSIGYQNTTSSILRFIPSYNLIDLIAADGVTGKPLVLGNNGGVSLNGNVGIGTYPSC